MTEPYSETVGQVPPASSADPYADVWDRPCPPAPVGCGAAVRQKCTFQMQARQPGGGIKTESRTRHHPCVARTKTKGGES
jgi:hypothetical protein